MNRILAEKLKYHDRVLDIAKHLYTAHIVTLATTADRDDYTVDDVLNDAQLVVSVWELRRYKNLTDEEKNLLYYSDKDKSDGN